MARPSRRKCHVCCRKEGDKVDLSGRYDGVPLGAIEKCDTCGHWACPDCLHEADCCFGEEFENTGATPAGWEKVNETTYVRQDAPKGKKRSPITTDRVSIR